jgi:Ras-related C3 botulinum toxin substrate 1
MQPIKCVVVGNGSRPLSYQATDVFLLYFFIVHSASFEDVRNAWYPELSHYCPRASVILVGTKSDRREDPDTTLQLQNEGQVAITYEQGMEMAKERGAVKYMECSALKQEGLQAIIDEGAWCGKCPPDNKTPQKASRSLKDCIV